MRRTERRQARAVHGNKRYRRNDALHCGGTHVEALVVGGGPAGSAAAFTLASRGIRTCVLDRANFPRDKLCGGLLTLRSKKIFERVFRSVWDPVIDATFHGISVLRHGNLLADIRNYSALFATQRYRFDAFLLGLAKEQGAIVRLGHAVKRLDLRANTVLLSDGSTIGFDYLVGADGVNSVVARFLFGKSFDPRTIGFALEQNVPRARLVDFPDVPEVHLDAAAWGYGWVFPKGDHAVIGVGGLHRKNSDLRERLHRFLISRCGDLPPGSIKGHFLPYGAVRSKPGAANILLVGDAAGLVDSMSGEGLAFAMQSGYAAALSIFDTIAAPTRLAALDHYRARYEEITRNIRLSNLYRPLIFLPVLKTLFARSLSRADAIQLAYLDIFADELEYDRLPGLIARQLLGLPFRLPRLRASAEDR